MMVSFLGGLQAIPGELYEAAEMDGATPWQRFRNVTLPGAAAGDHDRRCCSASSGRSTSSPSSSWSPAAARRDPPTSWSPTPTRSRSQNIRHYAGAATYGVVILSMLLVFATFYRRSQAKLEVQA